MGRADAYVFKKKARVRRYEKVLMSFMVEWLCEGFVVLQEPKGNVHILIQAAKWTGSKDGKLKGIRRRLELALVKYWCSDGNS